MLTELYDNQCERLGIENRFLRFIFHFHHKFLKMLKGNVKKFELCFSKDNEGKSDWEQQETFKALNGGHDETQ